MLWSVFLFEYGVSELCNRQYAIRRSEPKTKTEDNKMRDEPCIKVGPPLPFFPDTQAEIEELRNRLALMSLALEQIANDIKEDLSGRRDPLWDNWTDNANKVAWLIGRMEERRARLINEANTLKAEGQKNNTNGWTK